MFIERIQLKNLLSFGPDTEALELRPLNVLIGPNGSGKSNFIEAIGLLKATPRDLTVPIREGGGIRDWIWRGDPQASPAHIEVIIDTPRGSALRYSLGLAERGQQFELIEERIEEAYSSEETPFIYYELMSGKALLNYGGKSFNSGKPRHSLVLEQINPQQSILAQRKDPDQYRELTWLGEMFNSILLCQESSFGLHTLRQPQPTDLPNNFLLEDGSNLGLVLNRLERDPRVKDRILETMRQLYEGVFDLYISIEGGTVQLFAQEGNIMVPARRLSDGTLRFLRLVTILCNPNLPPLVCIEEPEQGLHPDVLPVLSDLLREASQRCQLVVTTHSDMLVDTLTDTPESVVVCEKHNGKTEMHRLDKADLTEWLNRYSLGDLWTRGDLGGNRW
ncbi:MAG: AAA family ATPase [Candidatus Latescibacteria bacterium]|nr:AAA family ATPase [Candidatus Latescibacterota bacterium]